MDLILKLIEALPKIKTSIQLLGSVVIAATIIATQVVAPEFVKGTICVGGIGVFLLIFGFLFERIDKFPVDQRAGILKFFGVLFFLMIFTMLSFAAVLITIPYLENKKDEAIEIIKIEEKQQPNQSQLAATEAYTSPPQKVQKTTPQKKRINKKNIVEKATAYKNPPPISSKAEFEELQPSTSIVNQVSKPTPHKPKEPRNRSVVIIPNPYEIISSEELKKVLDTDGWTVTIKTIDELLLNLLPSERELSAPDGVPKKFGYTDPKDQFILGNKCGFISESYQLDILDSLPPEEYPENILQGTIPLLSGLSIQRFLDIENGMIGHLPRGSIYIYTPEEYCTPDNSFRENTDQIIVSTKNEEPTNTGPTILSIREFKVAN